MATFDRTLIRYRAVIAAIMNPFYAGVYVYGKSEKRTPLVEGRVRKSDDCWRRCKSKPPRHQ